MCYHFLYNKGTRRQGEAGTCVQIHAVFDGVTTEAVAAASGVTKAMVYYSYGSKTNLFTAAIEWMMDVSRQQTQEILSRPVPLRDRLQVIALTRLRITAPFDLDAMMRGSRQVLTEEQLARIRHTEEQMVSVIAQAFQAGVAAGEVREIAAPASASATPVKHSDREG
ncbi:TetR/AcrR family transcriptional regulator [Alicyclobacillus macrosporangiidus]|uniref:TetR/AcrR family transcriptional regulator n=1 Tax=Alicyclobacillus macrosporangiidus TaxID=392015 RepID=UPI0009DF42E4|nr:TetR/AcrR family transcriptional regulator [Alicyclobacillus macrosporangiidus]